MKSCFYALMFFVLLTCDDFGIDKKFPLDGSKKYIFTKGQSLTYASDNAEEHFEVIKVVNGVFQDSQSGTCGKPRLFDYEFQTVYIKSKDSIDRKFVFVQEQQSDCGGYFGLTDKLISSINVSRNLDSNGFSDRVRWMDEFNDRISNYDQFYKYVKLRGRMFTDVFEFDVSNGKRIAKIYYTRRSGFVAYSLINGELFVLKE
jgi:hypothetical protein